ncbi:MAG: MiaB/RimO family radical SAM methylthiotransferase, partial [Ruminococcus sp.]
MNFKIFTFGCKVNQYETEYIRKIMCESGYISTEIDSEAQIFIVNSCAVTAVSESKCRRFIGRLRRNYPKSIIVLCGCMSQAFPRKYENFSPCDIVIGNGVHTEIPKLIKSLEETGERIIEILPHDRKNEVFEPCLISDFSERTRAYLKIEDGCDRFCSYCIIPYSRGRVRSKPLEDIKNEVDVLSKAGFEEIVLVGINLSKYGTDLGVSLWDAVSTIADCEKVKRIRLGSLEPELLTREILKNLSKCEKFCPQFHLSLQSGCNSTLKRMNRHYSSCEYREIVENIRSLFENPSFTTDVMVGFPGED